MALILSCSLATAREDAHINIGIVKKDLREYVKNGSYESDIRQSVDDALVVLRHLNLPKNSAFIFDVDETALSNMEYELKFDFGFEKETWDKWIFESRATAIKDVKRLYDSLINRGVAVIFLTGRGEAQHKATEANLISEGYTKFDTLICKPKEFSGRKAVEYKAEIRKRLSEKYTIMGTVGDQWSDHDGGWTVLKVKIPNLMYYLD